MGRRIAMLACVSGLASSKPYYKGHEAKDRIIHTNLKRDLSEGAEYVEAYCGSGQDVMTCWDSYVLIPLGDQFSKCLLHTPYVPRFGIAHTHVTVPIPASPAVPEFMLNA